MKSKSNHGSSMRAEVSKDRIIRDLRNLGVNEGDHIAVALSLKSIGYVKGGPEAFIDALLEAVGSNGTIMMNTFTLTFPLSEIAYDYVFDYKSTPGYTGLVPETLRKRRNSIRSLHPTLSVIAIGKLAKHLTEGHDEDSSPYMPYSRLAAADGKYLCIGIGNNLVAIRHEAQRRAGLFNVVPKFFGVRYRDEEGKLNIFVWKYPPCVEKLPELVPILRKMRIVKIGKIGMAHSILAPARKLIDAMTELLRNDPTLNLCDNILCLWCRDFERRMNLYSKIENPRFFQKSIFMIRIIALINRFRLKRYSFLSFRSGRGNEGRENGRLRLFGSSFLGTLRVFYLIFRDKIRAVL